MAESGASKTAQGVSLSGDRSSNTETRSNNRSTSKSKSSVSSSALTEVQPSNSNKSTPSIPHKRLQSRSPKSIDGRPPTKKTKGKGEDDVHIGHHSSAPEIPVFGNINAVGNLVIRACKSKAAPLLNNGIWPHTFGKSNLNPNPDVPLKYVVIKPGILAFRRGAVDTSNDASKRELLLKYVESSHKGENLEAEIRNTARGPTSISPSTLLPVGKHRKYQEPVTVYAHFIKGIIQFCIDHGSIEFELPNNRVAYLDIQFRTEYQRDSEKEAKQYIEEVFFYKKKFWSKATRGSRSSGMYTDDDDDPWDSRPDTQGAQQANSTILDSDRTAEIIEPENQNAAEGILPENRHLMNGVGNMDSARPGDNITGNVCEDAELAAAVAAAASSGQFVANLFTQRALALKEKQKSLNLQKAELMKLQYKLDTEKTDFEKNCNKRRLALVAQEELAVQRKSGLDIREQRINSEERKVTQKQTSLDVEKRAFDLKEATFHRKDQEAIRQAYIAAAQHRHNLELLEAGRKALDSATTVFEAKKDEHELKAAGYEKQAQNFNSILGQRQGRIVKLEEEVRNLKAENTLLKGSAESLRKEHETKDTTISKNEIDISILKSEITALKKAADTRLTEEAEKDNAVQEKIRATIRKLRLRPNSSLDRDFSPLTKVQSPYELHAEDESVIFLGKGEYKGRKFERYRVLQFLDIKVQGELLKTGFKFLDTENLQFSLYEHEGLYTVMQDTHLGTLRLCEGRFVLSRYCFQEVKSELTL